MPLTAVKKAVARAPAPARKRRRRVSVVDLYAAAREREARSPRRFAEPDADAIPAGAFLTWFIR